MISVRDSSPGTAASACRLVALYLPQFHPIAENDAWYGKGFTEWTHVARARPLFRGHQQPNLPADLGFYDLRVAETRSAQAALARAAGIAGFCYWHYWFAGRRLLERPFEEVLESGEPDFPFCLAWANESWTRMWYGPDDRVLLEQSHPGRADDEAHFRALLSAFLDRRYLRVDGRPIFAIYRWRNLPDAGVWAERWQALAAQHGLPGLHLVAIGDGSEDRPPPGFDALIQSGWSQAWRRLRAARTRWPALLNGLGALERVRRWRLGRPEAYPAEEATELALAALQERAQATPGGRFYPCVMPNWDNTPRFGRRGWLLHGDTPDLFLRQLEQAVELVAERPAERRLVFVKSWNEWAEGNYLEPDQRRGDAYLRAIEACVRRVRS